METPYGGQADTGRMGEDAAVAAYVRSGYRVLARNWRCPLGEIDVVLARGPILVICEVKSRRGSGFGGPFESVTWRKQRKLRALAQAFVQSSSVEDTQELRFDVASVTVDGRGRASVFVFEAAF